MRLHVTFDVAFMAASGHLLAMQQKRKSTGQEAKRHEIYGSAEVIEAFDALCELERKSRSEVAIRLFSAHVRKKSAKLRKSGYKIPATIFEK